MSVVEKCNTQITWPADRRTSTTGRTVVPRWLTTGFYGLRLDSTKAKPDSGTQHGFGFAFKEDEHCKFFQ